MAIQTQGSTGNVMEVDTAFKAARMSMRPVETLGWHSLGGQSGSLSGPAANVPLFAFRNTGLNPIIVRRVGLGFITNVAFTVPQITDFGLAFARNWTASDTGGTAIALTGSNCKHRTSLATPAGVDCRIATTPNLGNGTRTLDANYIGQQAGWSAGAGTTIPPVLNNLFQHDAGDYPLLLAQNEGIVIVNLTAFGAGGTGKLYVNMEFAEVVSY